MNPTITTLAALTLTTLTLAVGGTAAADTATCVVTLQPWDGKTYQAAYIDADGAMHVLEHRASQITGIPHRTLNLYAATDRCPAHKFRGQWYVDPTWVASMAAQRPKDTA